VAKEAALAGDIPVGACCRLHNGQAGAEACPEFFQAVLELNVPIRMYHTQIAGMKPATF
jgi:hypothetical protein